MYASKSFLIKIGIEKMNNLVERMVVRLRKNQFDERLSLLQEKQRQIEQIESGKNKFFERFTDCIEKMIKEKRKKIKRMEHREGPQRAKMMKKLLLNIGHMSSSDAILKTREIPNKDQEKVLQMKHNREKKGKELKDLLMTELIRLQKMEIFKRRRFDTKRRKAFVEHEKEKLVK